MKHFVKGILFLGLFTLNTIQVSAADYVGIDNIKEQTTCFSGIFSSYETWIATLRESRKKRFERQGVKDIEAKLDVFENGFKQMFQKDKYQLAKQNLKCHYITYSVDNQEVKGVIVIPNKAKGKVPAIIYNRGGTRNLGSLVFGHIAYELFPLALNGFAVIASEYRPNEQYGADNIDEVIELIEFIDKIPSINSEKIGVYGNSRGGLTSWQLAREKPNRISAIVTTNGVTDSKRWAENRPGIKKNISLIDGFINNPELVYSKLTPLEWASETSKAPILMLHSIDDQKVSVIHSLDMANVLTQNNRIYKLVIYENGGHSLNGHREDVLDNIISWFSKYLK